MGRGCLSTGWSSRTNFTPGPESSLLHSPSHSCPPASTAMVFSEGGGAGAISSIWQTAGMCQQGSVLLKSTCKEMATRGTCCVYRSFSRLTNVFSEKLPRTLKASLRRIYIFFCHSVHHRLNYFETMFGRSRSCVNVNLSV